MPIKIPDALPAGDILAQENIFVMGETRALTQDIRPLQILILNLMPTKIVTETQLLRLLGNTPLQIEAEFLQTSSYVPKNTSADHLDRFYSSFDQVRDRFFDGFIITGAPVENLAFDAVEYWHELEEVMEWSRTHVYSTLHICWGAQAGLYYHFGIPKYPLHHKVFGIFAHQLTNRTTMLLRGFDDQFWAPHSRHTEIRRQDVEQHEDLEILAESNEAGLYLIRRRDNRQVFVTGHPEYDQDTLAKEYFRDRTAGLDIQIPRNYFPGEDPEKDPIVQWRSHANLLFSNWLNYYVYQETPFDLRQLST